MTDTDQTILITGATSGLGRELARSLSNGPGHLILHGRSRQKLDELVAELDDAAATVDVVTADLAELAQVRQLADDVAELTDQLTVLINNAGVGKGSSDERELSSDGHELRLAVNHLAPFTLTLRLLPLLEIGAPSRIVNVASGAQQPVDFDDLHLEQDYSGNRAYAQSKFAMVATGFLLAEKLPPEVITVNSLHPATLMPTRMVEEGYGHTVDKLQTGVDAVRHLVESEDVEIISGQYFSIQQRSEAIPEAYDRQVQQRLWDLSEELTATRL